MPAASRTGRIPNTEWPAIVARRQSGETYAAIARDYEVTGPAIKYIVDKALAAGVTPADAPAAEPAVAEPPTAETAQAEAPEKATLSIGDPTPANDQPAAEVPANDAPAPDAPAPDAPAAAPSASAASPLAQRLLDATGECAALIEKAERGGSGMDETLKNALHQVRRAVAAIEIELSRGSGASAPAPIRQTARQAPQDSPAPKPAAPRATPDMPSNDGGGFGTHVVQGTVKFFHADKGFGFVIPDGGGSDIYVPLKAVRGSGLATLESEQRVRVAVTRGAKGPEAKEIEPIAA